MGFVWAPGDFFLVLSIFSILKIYFESLTFILILRFSPEGETPMAEEGGVPKGPPGAPRHGHF